MLLHMSTTEARNSFRNQCQSVCMCGKRVLNLALALTGDHPCAACSSGTNHINQHCWTVMAAATQG